MSVGPVSLVVLALAPWPLLRLLWIAPFRRWYRCIAWRIAALLFAYGFVIAMLWAYAPALLPVAASAAAVVLIGERLRSRASYGKRRGLPPGRLAVVPRGPWVDEAFFRKKARRYGPIFKTSQFLRPMVCVIGPGPGRALLNVHGARLQPPVVRFSTFIPRGFIRYMEPDDHAKYRRILQAALAQRVTRSADRAIELIVVDGLQKIAVASEESGNTGIHPGEYLEDMFLDVMVHLFLGIESQSPDMGRLRALYRQIDIRKAACRRTTAEFEAAMAIAGIIRQRGEEEVACGAEIVTSVLAALVAEYPDEFADDTLILNLVYMIQIGRGDMAGLLLWTLKLLVDNDKWLTRVRDSQLAESSTVNSLPKRIVKETLRLEQSEYIYRKASSEISFGGFVVPKGWLVRVCIRDGHRDPAIFDAPDEFNPDRFLSRTYSREDYCPLGMLEHACLGGNVIDMIAPTFVDELARQYDVVVRSDGPREYGRAHWQPSSRFRLSVCPRNSL